MWADAGLDAAKFDAVREGRVRMSPTEVRQLADSTIESFERQVAEKFRGVDLNEGQRLALVSLAFNGGIGLVGPRLTEAVREGRTADAVNEILYHSGTRVEPRLARRRYHEAQMFIGALDAPSSLPAFASYRANPTQPPT
jgi:GH24 family phage-related lysozyme (muramidase)